MAGYLVLGQPLCVSDKPNHDRIVIRYAVSMLATLKALLDPFLECDHRLFTISVHRKHSRHANQWNSSRDQPVEPAFRRACTRISSVGLKADATKTLYAAI